MKLWILRPNNNLPSGDNPWDPWYDKAFGFVVRAKTEDEARQIAHDNAGDENRGKFLNKSIANTQEPWLDGKYSKCKLLTASGRAGLIMRDAWRA